MCYQKDLAYLVDLSCSLQLTKGFQSVVNQQAAWSAVENQGPSLKKEEDSGLGLSQTASARAPVLFSRRRRTTRRKQATSAASETLHPDNRQSCPDPTTLSPLRHQSNHEPRTPPYLRHGSRRKARWASGPGPAGFTHCYTPRPAEGRRHRRIIRYWWARRREAQTVTVLHSVSPPIE